MAAETDEARQRAIEAFRDSLVDDVYAAKDFVPWQRIEDEVRNARPGVKRLNQLAQGRGRGIGVRALAAALLEEPTTYSVVQRLLAVPMAGVGFVDGRQLPVSPPRTREAARQLARLILDVGIERLVTSKAATEELLRVALISGDTRRRSNRRRQSLEEKLRSLLDEAVEHASEVLETPVRERTSSEMPPGVRNRLSRVLALEDGGPTVAVATMFEASGGGRQNETFRGFARVQDELDLVPASLILLADGRGVSDVPLHIVEEVWDGIGSVLSLYQAEEGALAEALVALLRNPLEHQLSRLPVDSMIGGALERGVSVEAKELPVDEEIARVAIARFRSDHPDLNLDVDSESRSVAFARSREVSAADELCEAFDPERALDLLATLVARRFSGKTDRLGSGQHAALLEMPVTPLIPGQLVACAQSGPATAQDVRKVASAARRLALRTTVALLIVPSAAEWISDPEREETTRTTATSVVVIDTEDLRRLAELTDVQAALSALLLRQADLTKVSPFVHSGVTPPQLFAGRRSDETSIVSALASSSIAVLGSRQIGKTSLLRRVESTLRAQGRTVYYGDCQAVGEWRGFRALAKREWGVELAQKFEPDQVAALAERLRVGRDPPLVILDEIDRLVAWDRGREVGGVTEAFFRALRAQSQAGKAQFVFSGERTIAEVLWSPQSPHWNFCQRHSLRQLDREDAAGLLFNVLDSLSVRFADRDEAEETLWRVTSGHPRLVQLLGDTLVQRLNERPGDERDLLTGRDLQAVIDTFDFKSEYVGTYWGQATAFEKELTRLVAEGERSLAALQQRVVEEDEPLALQILELYGIFDIASDEVRLRAEFLPEALAAAGPPPKAG